MTAHRPFVSDRAVMLAGTPHAEFGVSQAEHLSYHNPNSGANTFCLGQQLTNNILWAGHREIYNTVSLTG